MARLVRDPAGQPHLHDLAQVHDRDLMADQLHDPEIVGDEEVGKAEVLLQVAQQVHDLRLDGNIERARRLVGHDEPRAHGQDARDADPPLLAAGKLVRESSRACSS